MREKTLKDINFNHKLVLVRVDFNVPIKDGVIKDDNRIKEAIPTINYLIENGAKIILCSHLGKIDHKDLIKKEEDKKKNDLGQIVSTLSSLLKTNVKFCPSLDEKELAKYKHELKEKEVLLLQNVRYEVGEEKNDEKFSSVLAQDIDAFVMDAFGSAHRAHSSTHGVAKILNEKGKETCIGLLMEKEIAALQKCVDGNLHPYIAILGGAKVSDKIKVIEGLLDKADQIIIGGAMAYTFLKAKGVNVGKSRVELEQLDFALNCLNKAKGKIILPIDHIVANDFENPTIIKTTNNEEITDEMLGLDIGEKSIKLFNDKIKTAKMIFWNGPMGVFENPLFENGTRKIGEEIAKLEKCFSVIGGGDSASAAKKFGLIKNFSHVSTGGGASLEMIENNGHLPGVDIISKK